MYIPCKYMYSTVCYTYFVCVLLFYVFLINQICILLKYHTESLINYYSEKLLISSNTRRSSIFD